MRSFQDGRTGRLLLALAAGTVLLLAALVVIVGFYLPATSTRSNTAGSPPTAIAQTGNEAAQSTPTPLPAPTATTELQYGPHVGYMAPDFNLSDLDNNNVSLSSLRGHPVWINFWATWCAPCTTEMPDEQDLYDAHKSEGLRVLGVNLKEDPDTIRAFANRLNLNFTFLLDWEGFGNTAADTYQVQNIPVHVFVDKAGVIQYINIGPMDSGSMDAALETILPK